MAGNRMSLGRHLRVPSRQAGEVALACALLGALVFATSDATPNHAPVDPVIHQARFVAATPVHLGWVGAAIGDRPQLALVLPAKPPPAMILIPALNVHRPVEAVGVDRYGTMYVPKNLWNAGWYEDGPVPGAPGDAVIEGHAGYPDAPLLFGKLGTLRLGDQIVIVLTDGSRQLFLVRSVRSWPATAHPPGLFDAGSQPRLTLITCSGTFNDKDKTYPNRLVVEAAYAGLG